LNKDFQQLRKIFEGSDPFMGGGHQIVKLRRRKRIVPEWTGSNKEVRKVLLRSFPKLATDSKQRASAARWARIIHLFFRLRYTYRQTAAELEAKPESVRAMIMGIKRVAAGKWANGQGILGIKPRGRPKIGVSISKSLGGR
jgi:hypothetical protein